MQSFPGPWRNAAIPALVVVLAAGCAGSQTATATPEASTTTAAPTGGDSKDTASPQPWFAIHDEAGVAFYLPHEVQPVAQEGRPPVKVTRVYQDEVNMIGLTVTITEASAAVDPSYPEDLYAALVRGLTSAGATDALLSRISRPKVAVGTAREAALTFTATDGSHNYWRMRTIVSGHLMVSVQALTFSDDGDDGAQAPVDAIFEKVIKRTTLG